jgi:branched-chain amino acid transport system permease protein
MKSSPSNVAYRRDLFILIAMAIGSVAVFLTVRNSFHLNLLTYTSIYAIAALGLFLLFGYAGQISLAQGAFFGIGAYTTSYLTMQMSLPSMMSMIIAGALAGLTGWLVAKRLLRLTNNYLAMATLAFGSICVIVFGQARSITGGLDPGMIGVPAFSIFGLDLRSPKASFALCATVLLLAILVTVNLIHSRIGRSLRALRSSEVAAEGLGIEVLRYKVSIFAIAASMTGVAGSLFAHVQQSFNAASFSVGLSLDFLLMVVIGSVFTPWGAVIGALFTTVLPHFLEGFEHFKFVIYGVIMTIVMVYMPDGLGKALVDTVLNLIRKLRKP